MLLNVKDLVAGYGYFRAIRNVSLSVRESEIVAVLGPNGAGKTTLIKAIVGLVKSIQGLIEFCGDRIDQLPGHETIRKGISVCPEGGPCFPDMSVLKNLMMGAIFSKNRATIQDAYDMVIGLFPILEKRKEQKAGSLSGGERQMLAIGRALMGAPRLLLMDEPSLGLAPLVIDAIFDVIKKLPVRGLSILLVEQNASKSLEIAGRGYVMDLGKIVVSGHSKELRTDEKVKNTYFGI
jgi:branched-chain amino acid transport system ATP-binding protein